ncbi:MAG: aminoacyl-tRNA hydrolase [Alphaproteobacteria bacterium]|nr:aminoacyl-tRNA hydrolase [Alphaproteobacteria bacterium]
MSVYRITPEIWVSESELKEAFVRSPGPGGQNVNKVASAVELRFDVAHSPSLPEDVKQRLRQLAGRQINKDGVLVLKGRRFRDQHRNRDDVRARLVDLLIRAAHTPKLRLRSAPPRAVKERRLTEKRAHSTLKRLRSRNIEA